jgi:hypothetical protein
MTSSAVLTIDVHDRPNLAAELDHLIEELDGLRLKATVFVPAILVEDEGVLGAVRRLGAEGHEIGCHGLTHDAEDSYAHLPEEEQRERLMRATEILEGALQSAVTLFRAPVFRLSAATLTILAELGYVADTSVPSTRLSVLSSDMWNAGYLWAPRRPYHPSSRSAFRRGSVDIWEVPVSCILIPFTVSFLQVFGLQVMKAYLGALHTESRMTGKPIVYMAHPEDFFPSRLVHPKWKFGFRQFLPSRTHGLAIRYAFGERDEHKIYELNTAFVGAMADNDDLEFRTLGDFVAGLDECD